MNTSKRICAVLVGGLLATAWPLLAADHSQHNEKTAGKPKPYPLKTCIVSGEKLDGDMGKPYVFVHEGQEIKLCCKDCLKDFQKDPAKYLKKIAEADKGGKEGQKPGGPAHDHGQHPH